MSKKWMAPNVDTVRGTPAEPGNTMLDSIMNAHFAEVERIASNRLLTPDVREAHLEALSEQTLAAIDATPGPADFAAKLKAELARGEAELRAFQPAQLDVYRQAAISATWARLATMSEAEGTDLALSALEDLDVDTLAALVHAPLAIRAAVPSYMREQLALALEKCTDDLRAKHLAAIRRSLPGLEAAIETAKAFVRQAPLPAGMAPAVPVA